MGVKGGEKNAAAADPGFKGSVLLRYPIDNLAAGTGGPPPTPPAGSLIINIVVSNGNTYQKDTITAGQLTYNDQNHTFTSVPSVLEGLEFIRTSDNDKDGANPDFLTFGLTVDSMVYVLFDDRVDALPAWLDDGSWSLTKDADGMIVTIGTTDVTRRVYQKKYDAGTVALGGNAMEPMTDAQSMYNVAATFTAEVMPGVVAEPSLVPFDDPLDRATGVKLGVARVYDSITGEDVPAQLARFHAQISYDQSCVNILGVRDLDFAASDVNIDDPLGITTFAGVASPAVPAPSDLNHIVARLLGSNQVPCVLALNLDSLLDDGGNSVLAPDTSVQNLLRGDARADGVVNITDSLFIAQHLMGSRPVCTTVVDTTCLHSFNAASVRQDGALDEKTIADAVFIAQYLVGLRDESYGLAP